MDHDVDAPKGQGQPLAVADVAEEEAHGRHGLGPEPLGQVDLHLMLLELVAAVDDQLARLGAGEHGFDEAAAEGAGAAGDKDDLAVEI